jgi:hypothetical protein
MTDDLLLKNKLHRIRNNDLESGKILLTCMEWLKDETQITQSYVFFCHQRKLHQPTLAINYS